MRKTCESIGIAIIIIAVNIPIIFFISHVISDTAMLYGISQISKLDHDYIVYGVMLFYLFRGISKKADNEDEKADVTLRDGFIASIRNAILVLFSWGMFYLIHPLL